MEMQISGGNNKMSLSDKVFAAPYREALIHQVVVAWQAGARAGTKRMKSRSDARGGGAKPWRQKGTGRARAGTRRSPIWRGGGVTFAGRPRDHSQKVNKRMYRAAMSSILSQRIRDQQLSVVEDFVLEEAKTRLAIERLRELGWDGSESLLLVYGDEVPENSELAVRNLPWVLATTARQLNPYELMATNRVVMTDPACRIVEAWLQS